MTKLIRAELLKARATRSFWALGAIAVVYCLGWAAAEVFGFLQPGGHIEDAYSMAQQGYVFVMVLGIHLTAGEYRHKTITWAYLVTPRRGHVITAKLASAGLIGLAVGVVAAVLTDGASAVMLGVAGYPVLTSGVPALLLGSVLATALWAVFGASLGMLIRNLSAATAVAFVWFAYVEWMLMTFVPGVVRWLPTGASEAIVGFSRTGFPTAGGLLPAWGGVVLLLGYAVVAAVAARAVSVNRDVT
ncbi:ABC transporter permease [Kibdelosporangium lantanae]